MLSSEIQNGVVHRKYKSIETVTLSIKSKALNQNPLGDPVERHMPCLVPKGWRDREDLPVVLILAGFTGVGSKYLNVRFHDENMADVLDKCISSGDAPEAIYVLVDAMTYWGGSQFINSKGTGKYEDFLIKELHGTICFNFPVSYKPEKWCVMGGSSGGYGALHLVTKFPEKFGHAVAIAPDSFFEASLLPEIYQALPTILKKGGVKGIKKEIETKDFANRRDSHTVMNAIGMGTCYAPDTAKKGEVKWPIDAHTGAVKPTIWKQWLKHDPIYFIPERKKNLKKIKSVYLDVGTRDQFNLQYGTRQIHQVLKKQKVNVRFTEFNGSHFDIGDRRPQAWKWLKGQLK